MKWTTTQLIAAGAMGSLLALAAMTELPLNVITGVPGSGAIVGTFFEVTVFLFALLLIPHFGTAAIVSGIAMLIVLPLPVFGPAGFWPKVLLGIFLGLLFDALFLFFKRYGRWGLVILTPAIILLADIAFFFVLGLKIPGVLSSYQRMTLPIFVIFNAIFIIEGVAASIVAWHVFQKLKNTAVVKRIRGA